jgi:hypothetical protein
MTVSCHAVSTGDNYKTVVEHIAKIEDVVSVDNNRKHHGLYSDVNKRWLKRHKDIWKAKLTIRQVAQQRFC